MKYITLIFFTGLISGCGIGSLFFGSDPKVDNKSHRYSALRLDKEKNSSWFLINEPQSQDKELADYAFEQRGTGSIITLNSSCREKKEMSLEALSQNLLLGLNTQDPISTKDISIDDVPAIESTANASVSSASSAPFQEIPVQIRVVVLRKSDCTYDLIYIAKPGNFESGLPHFERFVRGFHAY